ncbi:hypothetical protein PCASD_16953 [Puccinia coronata f. sp. avenae]|uniref:Glycoside hydrolase 131 catalytic N-terminal domain-containing protein n=1 Tax=Puccinia coronata f. sp. avenae TaxID=200324 RepID=A0A2N5SYA5_9BASI|nr:hypothetical protein PCASD_16953 [Puccinia coronata f. sp. avenae]
MAALFEAHYRVPLNAKVADIDNPGSALGKLTQFKIIGSNTVNDAYEFQKTPNGKFQSITFKINDNSIFKPDKNPKNDQVGFRRNDLLPKYDAKAIETKKRTYHHSFIFKKDLDKKHGYLLASVEFPKACQDGAHLYDLHYGTPFKSENVQGTLSPDANKIKLRDINFQTLFSVDMVIGQVFNFAIEIDWDKKQLRAFHSVGDEKLVEVVKTTPITPKNAKVVNFAGTGEWHLQMIKEPLPNPKDPEKERSDVPHKGIQEKGIKEEIIQLRNFIEDTSTAPGSTDPDGPGGSTSAGSSAPAGAGSTAGATSTTTAIKNNGKNKRR